MTKNMCGRPSMALESKVKVKTSMPPSQQGRWGYIVFSADSVAVAVDVHFFVSKQLVDFDQTCIYTLMRGEEKI